MSRDCNICLPEPCKTVDDLDLFSLQSPVFPFVLNCPPGSTCNLASVALLACCDEDVPVTIPQSASDTEALALLQQALADCARKQLFCGEIDQLPDPNNPVTVFFNESQTAEVECPDGTTFSYTIGPGRVIGLSRAAANAAARRLALQRAREHRFCIASLPKALCQGVFFSKRIRAIGQFVAKPPAQDFWQLMSGSLPPGMTLPVGFQTDGVLFSGTPTTIGTFTFTLRLKISTLGSEAFGDFNQKTFTIKIVGITNTSPLPDAPVGQFYSVTLNSFGADVGYAEFTTWKIVSGTFPDWMKLVEIDSQAVLFGTPTMPLGYQFEIEVFIPILLVNVPANVEQVVQNFNASLPTLPIGRSTPEGITCRKTFQLEVTASEIISYYNCESLAGNLLEDQSGDRDISLVPSGGTTLVVGKIGNGWTCDQFEQPTVDDPFFDFQNGFTLRFWYNLNAFNWDSTNPTFFRRNTVPPPPDYWEVRYFVSGPTQITWEFTIVYNGGLNTATVQTVDNTPAIPGDIFHRLVCVFDKTLNQIKIAVDNEVFVVTILSPAAVSFAPGNGLLLMDGEQQAGQNLVAFDECGLWRDYAWTDADKNTDWNSGNGITWPAAGGIHG